MRAFLTVSVVVLAACRSPSALDRSAAADAPATAPVSFGGGLHGGTPNPDPTSAACAGGPADGTDFGLYVLALSWAPDFCCKNPDRGECDELGAAYGGSHFTLHGLWPTYDDRESAAHGYAWPEFCGDCSRCKHASPGCSPDPSTLPDGMRKYGPGYVTDHHFLAGHEWPRHGACTGLSPGDFFEAALGAMLRLPGKGTPAVVSKNVGGSVRLRDLKAAFTPPGTVLFGCDGECNLTQVGFCLDRDPSGAPGEPVTCPQTVSTQGGDDNGCVVQDCSTVHLRSPGDACARGQPGRGG